MPGWLYLAVFSPVVVLSGIGIFFWAKDKLAARRRLRERAIKQRMLNPFPGGHPAPTDPWQPLQEYSPEFSDQIDDALHRHGTAMRAGRPKPAARRADRPKPLPRPRPRGDDTPPAA